MNMRLINKKINLFDKNKTKIKKEIYISLFSSKLKNDFIIEKNIRTEISKKEKN